MTKPRKIDLHRAGRPADSSNRLVRPAPSPGLLARQVSPDVKELPVGGRLGDIKSLLLSELEEELRELGEPNYRAGQIVDWLYQKRVDTFEQMTDLPQALRAQLAEKFASSKIDIVRVLGSQDTTRKFLFRLSDGNLIESVLIPASPALYGNRSDRRTICVSTQVGCAYGCKFCASGLEGFSRNLRRERNCRSIDRDRAGQRLRRSTTSYSWGWANRWPISIM